MRIKSILKFFLKLKKDKDFQENLKNFQAFRIAIPLFIIVLVGTTGYHQIEKWSILDSMYMTITTLTTVGFGEVHPLSEKGRFFTMLLIIVGVGTFAYVVSHFTHNLYQAIFALTKPRKRMEEYISRLHDHFIICGYGRIGQMIANDLKASGKKFIVIDSEPLLDNPIFDQSIPFIQGDASMDEVLNEAGIKKACGLVAAVSSDAENVFITLTARGLNSEIFIIARYEDESTKKKFFRAGANRVVNPYQIGSEKISRMILKPTVNTFLELANDRDDFNLIIEEVAIEKNSFLNGKSLQESNIRNDFNLIIIAVEPANGKIIFNPRSDHKLLAPDKLVLIGDKKGLDALNQKIENI